VLLVIFTVSIDAYAQTAKLPRVGVLTVISLDRPQFRGFQAGIDEFGYVIGKNLDLDMTQRKDFTELEAAIVQRATQEIPVVFITTNGR
jgi:hypothetical protein